MRAFLIFAVTFFSYAYFYEGAGWNQNSRFDMVRAIVERGILSIDDFQSGSFGISDDAQDGNERLQSHVQQRRN